VLRRAGVPTYESCEGGPGHAFPEPTVRFRGDIAEGFAALVKAIDAEAEIGLGVYQLRRVWRVDDGEPTGPWWDLVFREDVRSARTKDDHPCHLPGWISRCCRPLCTCCCCGRRSDHWGVWNGKPRPWSFVRFPRSREMVDGILRAARDLLSILFLLKCSPAERQSLRRSRCDPRRQQPSPGSAGRGSRGSCGPCRSCRRRNAARWPRSDSRPESPPLGSPQTGDSRSSGADARPVDRH
jgi:hypothetical protein